MTPLAFSLRNLTVIGYCNGFTLWHYKAKPSDTLNEICVPGFFADAGDILAPGDQMTISGPNFGANAFVFGEGRSVRAVVASKAEAI
jgi:hypothetical protein